MTKAWQMKWETIVTAPIVLGLILAGVWLSLNAAAENLRISSASDQIASMVSLARDMEIPAKASATRVSEAFFRQVQGRQMADVVVARPAFVDQPAHKGYENPWGDPVAVFFYPASRAIRLEGSFSASACRRLLFLYAKEAAELGLRRVDVKNDDGAGGWRLVYQQNKKAPPKRIGDDAIYVGCGKEGDVLLSLSFSL